MTDSRPDIPPVEPPQESADPERRAERQEHLQVELEEQGFPIGTRIQVPRFYVPGPLDSSVAVIGYIGTITRATRTKYQGRSVPAVEIEYDTSSNRYDTTKGFPTVFALPRLYESNPITEPDESFQPMDADARQASGPFSSDRYVNYLFHGDGIRERGSRSFLSTPDAIEVGSELNNCLEGCALEDIHSEIISGGTEVVTRYRNYVKNISELIELLDKRIGSERTISYNMTQDVERYRERYVTTMVMLKLNLEAKQKQIEQWLEEVEVAQHQDIGV